jgi:hypothetical protein
MVVVKEAAGVVMCVGEKRSGENSGYDSGESETTPDVAA